MTFLTFLNSTLLTAASVLLLCLVTPSYANARQSELCDQAALVAAQEFRVPFDILRSITRTETGRTQNGSFEPWPWAINMSGQGEWFASEAEAKTYANFHLKRGVRNIDVGCFQINHRWHAQEFPSLEAMFNPIENARYAARFLSKLHGEMGSWERAVGAYHSRTPKYAQRYLRRFNEVKRDLEAYAQNPVAPQEIPTRTTLGSLVPMKGATTQPFAFFKNTGPRE